MAQDNCQKIKLLKLIELFHQQTDEQHPLVTAEICKRLASLGISCDRRTLAKDIALLNEQGFEVLWRWIGKEKAYYTEDRSFSIPELKILIDAVQATSFITPKKTQELIDKIANLGGSHRAEILKKNQICFNTCKHSNERIYYSVDCLEDALQHKRKATFRYFDLDEKGEKAYRREGTFYIVEPVALVFNEDNYYLVCYSPRYQNTVNYRIDRMESVAMMDEPICDEALAMREDISQYTEQVFKMYGGQAADIVIEFNKSLIGVVYDKFGETTAITPCGEGRYHATITVQISPVFWGWMFQFAGEMKILSPESVIAQYQARAKRILE